ncbi:Translocation protein S66 [Malassezia psittaci]|uniref:Translocation protein S66 n=1 Tax=Malassezia psittaci TaxID=1821823 RepID=A0AAF0F8A0_9BASI|nr:Translocation protein S66 [Malassezia psittaci]
MALPIIVPIAYIVTLLAGLAAFSKVYRRRESKRLQAYQQSSSASQEVNPQRAIYHALADIQEEFPDGDAKDNRWVVPRATLQGALLARAVEVLKSMNELRSDKQALAALLERGSVGDDAAVLLETMDNDIRKEVMEIVREAGKFDQSWSKLIFQSANEVLANLRCRDILLDITKQREEEIAKTRQLGLPVPTIGQN